VLWDTDGDFGLSIFSTIYLKGATGAVIVGDVSRPSSVNKMADLVAQFMETMPGRPCIAVLNKTDLLAQGEGVPEVGFEAPPDAVLTTSAKNGSGITEAFAELAKAIRRRQI
ncbi:MAG: GTPase domain-containing protein, partial [Hyphomicrobiales bacterium]|nr:GTPase domain-containing protein [Hyphomicrobiales bacterium]